LVTPSQLLFSNLSSRLVVSNCEIDIQTKHCATHKIKSKAFGAQPLLIIAAYLMVPVIQVQAQGCMEYTVWNEQAQRCECTPGKAVTIVELDTLQSF